MMSSLIFLQLTNETLSEYVAVLSQVVLESQGSEVDQHEENLKKISDIFSMITNHVTDFNMMIHKDVSINFAVMTMLSFRWFGLTHNIIGSDKCGTSC